MRDKIIFSFVILCGVFGKQILSCTIYSRENENYLQQNSERQRRSTITKPSSNETSQKLEDLRSLMISNNISAYIVPIDDQGRLAWISGFTGSNGKAIITLHKAALWTDGRYFTQAEDQLNSNWELMKIGEPGVPNENDWLTSQDGAALQKGSLVGADPELTNAQGWLDLDKILEKVDSKLFSVKKNLIDLLWTEETGRPPFVPKTVRVYPLQFAGKSVSEKLIDLRKNITKLGASTMVVTEQDEIAWLFNLRGEGESLLEGLLHSPIFQSTALVSMNEVIIWVHQEKLFPDVADHLAPQGCQTNYTCVQIKDINSVLDDLKAWSNSDERNSSEKIVLSKASVYLDGASYAIYESIPSQSVIFSDSPLIPMKAVKNGAEIEGMISSHVRDAIALAEFFSHLEEDIKKGDTKYTELSAAELLLNYRSEQPFFKSSSFSTISAFGPNAAIIHYTPTPETDAQIDTTSLYMVDSGGQYENGATTDVTRTLHFGNPKAEQIQMYTRVLMGSIDLARISLPDKSLDVAIDLVTRQHLFEENLNYRHGTGHGIGAYLKVHEGPINIGMGGGRQTGKLQANMFFSDEPGFYKDKEYGIRLETILRVVAKNATEKPFGDFIRFEPVTLVPFETHLIDFGMMSPPQIEWFNEYNIKINENVATILQAEGRNRAFDWVIARTKHVNPAVSYQVQRWKEEF